MAAYWAQPISSDDLDFRVSSLVTFLNDWGQIRYADEPSGLRRIRISVDMSTFSEPGVRLIYAEEYAPIDVSWRLREYQYNFSDSASDRFFGYHHHPIQAVGGLSPITHVHCRPGAPDEHLRGIWIELVDAHWEFVTWAAEPARFPLCQSYRPLMPA